MISSVLQNKRAAGKPLLTQLTNQIEENKFRIIIVNAASSCYYRDKLLQTQLFRSTRNQ